MAVDRENSAAAKRVTAIGFGPRAGAFLIDLVVVWFLGIVLGTVVGIIGLVLTTYSKDAPPPLDLLIILFGLAFSIAYFVAAWAKSGQTLGKMAVGIKVVGADGQPPSGGKALLRYLGYILNGLVLSLGFLWVNLDRKRQGWHDKIAGTYVVHDDVTFSDVNAVNLEPDDKPGWVWIVLWVFLALTMPLALVATIWGMGPYVSRLLVSILAGG